METSKNLLRALDMVTTPKEPRPERLGAVSVAHAQQMRTIFDDPNVIGVGISEKVTGKRRTGELSLCFYVEKKVSERQVSRLRHLGARPRHWDRGMLPGPQSCLYRSALARGNC